MRGRRTRRTRARCARRWGSGWRARRPLAKANGDPFAGDLFAIAAPHVSPQGGWQSYRAAYGMLRPEHKDRTFVILATSHYGEPETFGLTRKTFRTPLGDAPADTALVDWLAARGGKGVEMEDYCHSFEHTVELQVIFLQHVLGPGVKILPVLVGPFARSIYQGGDPEDDDKVKAFFEALGELREREGDRLFWVMGVDMAHMGARYHDRFAAVAGEGAMQEVGARDEQRIERINALDAGGFWDLVRERQDDLEVVRVVAVLYVLEDGSEGARGTAEVRAVEHRRKQRGELRGDGVKTTIGTS